MDIYIYYSIIFFGLIIFSLYIYLIFEKTRETYIEKKKVRYNKYLIPYIDKVINVILEEKDLDDEIILSLKANTRNSIKREIIAERISYYLNIFKGNIVRKITLLCEELGFIDYDIKNLKSSNKFLVALACKRLGEYRSRKSIIHLMKVFDSPFTDIKYNALMALAKIGDEEAFMKAFEKVNNDILLNERSLIEIVDSFEGDKQYIYDRMMLSKNDYISAIFIKSAGNYMDLSMGNKIAKFMFDKNKEKRIACIKALGNMADSRYAEDIINLLEDQEWEVRAIAAKVLGRFDDDRALYPLIKSLSDRQWYVRYNAAISILNFEEGFEMLPSILEGEDKFAKDIIISAMENLNLEGKLSMLENSSEVYKKNIARYIREYQNKLNEGVSLKGIEANAKF